MLRSNQIGCAGMKRLRSKQKNLAREAAEPEREKRGQLWKVLRRNEHQVASQLGPIKAEIETADWRDASEKFHIVRTELGSIIRTINFVFAGATLNKIVDGDNSCCFWSSCCLHAVHSIKSSTISIDCTHLIRRSSACFLFSWQTASDSEFICGKNTIFNTTQLTFEIGLVQCPGCSSSS